MLELQVNQSIRLGATVRTAGVALNLVACRIQRQELEAEGKAEALIVERHLMTQSS